MPNNQQRLEDILTKAAHDESKASSPPTLSEAEHQAAILQFFADFRAKRQAIIIPTIETISTAIREHGHEVEVDDDVADEENPRIEVRFTPKFWGDRNPSKFCVSADPRRKTIQFWNSTFSSCRYPVKYISADLVEHHLLNYIEGVFEHLYDK